MFTYKIIKHEDEENGTLYALYEVTTASDGEVMVMGQAPVNGVFYESVDELAEHIDELHTYVKQVQSGEQTIADADEVTFVDMEPDCCDDDDCDCGDEDTTCECDENCECKKESCKENADNCDCKLDKAGFHSFDDKQEWHGHKKKDGCCSGGCGCH